MSAFLYTVTFGGAPGPYLPLAGGAMDNGAIIDTADNPAGTAGALTIGTGASTGGGGDGGPLTLATGAGDAGGISGPVILQSGNDPGGGVADTGSATIQSGDSEGARSTGTVTIFSGFVTDMESGSTTGDVVIGTGELASVASGPSGAVPAPNASGGLFLATGNSKLGDTGLISITTGISTSGTRGSILTNALTHTFTSSTATSSFNFDIGPAAAGAEILFQLRDDVDSSPQIRFQVVDVAGSSTDINVLGSSTGLILRNASGGANASVQSQGGALNITNFFNGGGIKLQADDAATTTAGGPIDLFAGDGGSTGVTAGGAVTITAGAGGTGGAGTSGAITIESPAAGGSGVRGALNTIAGITTFTANDVPAATTPFAFVAGTRHTSVIFSITDDNDDTPLTRFQISNSGTDATDAIIRGANRTLFFNSVAGNVHFLQSISNLIIGGQNNSGNISINPGDSTTGTGGGFLVNAGQGQTVLGDGGPITLTSGPGGATSGDSGGISLVTGAVTTGTRGGILLDAPFIGFYGTAPAAQPAAYTRNAAIVEDRTLLASASATILNNNNVLAALIGDLQSIGLLG